MPKPSCGRVSSLDFRSSDSTRPCSSGANLPIFPFFRKCQPREPTTDMSNDPKKLCTLVTCAGNRIIFWWPPARRKFPCDANPLFGYYINLCIWALRSANPREKAPWVCLNIVQTSKHVHTHASLCSPIMSGNFRTVSLNPYLAPQSSMGCCPGRQDHLNVSLWIT